MEELKPLAAQMEEMQRQFSEQLRNHNKLIQNQSQELFNLRTHTANHSHNPNHPGEDEQDPTASEDSSSLTGLSEEADTGSNKSKESNDDAVAASLIPEPPTEQRVLRDQTQAVKPAKYTYLTTDPTSFKSAMASTEKDKWQRAADKELSSIKSHQVWEDMFDTPKSFLRTVWTFKTKPATLLATERKKARCGTTLGRIELERDECLKGCLSLVAGRVEVDKNKSMDS
ncbi:hypothetical protein PCANC_28133 [Puccinia coronata f. sp. avenae]|uniref:Reverse transcriptase Ty1/copia-type domain-containing protein n=1 Tax=Puccinia coronata f. sp. avenae TaxID=200324 RepID=A0A2N5S0E2_9BASI|nr:hypothetical protein PCANC_28133 [Puccinia coronata f. sp. avenae]